MVLTALRIKPILIFIIVNSLLLLIISNLYDWQGEYFIWGSIGVIIPNLISLALGTMAVNTFKELVNKPLWLVFILVLINEVAFAIYERRIVFFDLIEYKTPKNIIAVDSNYYLIISACGLASAIVTMLYSQKWKKQNT
ncbi:hypothetical protein [Pontibacter flavimaris]|uniref:Uncharacterized protein n=1 Tax=Pontibacter flavimaris TaxID=1797110 RepID=A0A1Q5PFT9_9BACT|nr:hypothetical protein [Pontibacter flavimaris]OKL41094.1 hypothetical protein A3841_14815 [Pontibacter flavimaris]